LDNNTINVRIPTKIFKHNRSREKSKHTSACNKSTLLIGFRKDCKMVVNVTFPSPAIRLTFFKFTLNPFSYVKYKPVTTGDEKVKKLELLK